LGADLLDPGVEVAVDQGGAVEGDLEGRRQGVLADDADELGETREGRFEPGPSFGGTDLDHVADPWRLPQQTTQLRNCGGVEPRAQVDHDPCTVAPRLDQLANVAGDEQETPADQQAHGDG